MAKLIFLKKFSIIYIENEERKKEMMTMPDLRELIPTEEKEMIDRYILNYAVNKDRYINEGRRVTVNKILKPWANSKSLYLRKLFQDKLIIEQDISFSTPKHDLVEKMENNHEISEFRREFHKWIGYYIDQLYLKANNDNDDNAYFTGVGLRSLINLDTLANNSYSCDRVTITTPDDHKIILSEGCKPVKMIGKLNAAFHISEKFEAFRIAVSTILNVKNIKGKLCLSIHPMDYMTMSDNNCNWESCMSWINWGSYRQGTVEMMNSPYVIVAYIRAKDDMRAYNDYWNNKRWRSLYIVHPDFFGNIKGYPYQASDVDKIVLEKLKEMSAAAGFQAQYSEIQQYDYNSSHPIINGKEMSISFHTGYMYNDFGTTDHYCCVREDLNTDYFELDYSGPSECMWCGNINIDIDSEEYLVCSDCDETFHCDCCGGSFTEDELYYTNSGPVCEMCLKQYFEEDARHGEYWYREDLTQIFVLPDSFKEGIENKDILVRYNASCADNLPTFFDCDYFIYGVVTEQQKEKIKQFEKATLVKDAHLKYYENEYGVDYFYVYQSDLLPRFKKYISNQCYERGYDFEELWYYSDRVSYASDEARKKYRDPLLEDY